MDSRSLISFLIVSIMVESLALFSNVDADPITSGFSLKLIHRDSPESPIYPGNLTEVEQLQRLIGYSKARILQLSGMHSPARLVGFAYVVQVGVGTPPTTHHLIFDTGSSLTWIQCAGCNPRFPQSHALFDPTESSTARLMSCDSRSHATDGKFNCVNNRWIYNMRYGPRSTSSAFVKGSLYQETFLFQSSESGQSAIPGLVFGCNSESHNIESFRGQLDGITGMGRDRTSFIAQLSTRNMPNKFSYCFTPSRTTYVRFGEEAVMRERNAVATPIRQVPRDRNLYFLNLIDISIDQQRLGFRRGAFEPRSDGTGGVIIDSGTAFTFPRRDAYDRVVGATRQYMESNGAEVVYERPQHVDFEYCWKLRGVTLPSMTFHFEGRGADLLVKPKNLFFHLSSPFRFFCLALFPDDRYTTIGVMQQQDVRFVYDNHQKQILFAEADCSSYS